MSLRCECKCYFQKTKPYVQSLHEPKVCFHFHANLASKIADKTLKNHLVSSGHRERGCVCTYTHLYTCEIGLYLTEQVEFANEEIRFKERSLPNSLVWKNAWTRPASPPLSPLLTQCRFIHAHASLPRKGRVTQRGQSDICLSETLSSYVVLGSNLNSTSGCPFKMQIKYPHYRVIRMTERGKVYKALDLAPGTEKAVNKQQLLH